MHLPDLVSYRTAVHHTRRIRTSTASCGGTAISCAKSAAVPHPCCAEYRGHCVHVYRPCLVLAQDGLSGFTGLRAAALARRRRSTTSTRRLCASSRRWWLRRWWLRRWWLRRRWWWLWRRWIRRRWRLRVGVCQQGHHAHWRMPMRRGHRRAVWRSKAPVDLASKLLLPAVVFFRCRSGERWEAA